MKARHKKPATLSPNQEKVWQKVYGTPLTQRQILKRSGISATALRYWLQGVREPSKFYLNTLLEAIEQLNNRNTQGVQH
ncbi:hypothetical protein P4S73_04815 [Paraglaciecola sp. Hal342]|jgi:SOS-response transcriptional repressor LexA